MNGCREIVKKKPHVEKAVSRPIGITIQCGYLLGSLGTTICSSNFSSLHRIETFNYTWQPGSTPGTQLHRTKPSWANNAKNVRRITEMITSNIENEDKTDKRKKTSSIYWVIYPMLVYETDSTKVITISAHHMPVQNVPP